LLGSKGESAVTRFTAASLIPGGATAELAGSSEPVVSDSEDDSTVGCLGVVLKKIENKCLITRSRQTRRLPPIFAEL